MSNGQLYGASRTIISAGLNSFYRLTCLIPGLDYLPSIVTLAME